MTKQMSDKLSAKIDASVQAAVAAAIEEHRRAGRSIVVWRDGKVVTLAPHEIPVRCTLDEDKREAGAKAAGAGH